MVVHIRHTVGLILLLCLTIPWVPNSTWAQQTGVPTQVSLPSGSGSLTLDFSVTDYQLILYSARRDEPDTTNTYDFTVSTAFSARPVVRLATAATRDGQTHKSRLREEERELTLHIHRSGRPAAAKQAAAFQIGTTRTFNFEEFGDVSTQTVMATLVATSNRAEAWVDNNTSAISTQTAQDQIDRFSSSTYPIVTDVFGAPSDVDGNGKVLFLYTELVDQVGGVAGFYRARSLFSSADGGDGNAADMMFIGLDHEVSFFESLLAHEFQHLINYNQHVLVQDGSSEISPINEAMSHIAEDLVDQHVEGGNPGNVRTYTEAPQLYSILAESAHDSGVRGTAYTFARSMMESYGDDIPTRLVQTGLSGIDNVENVSGQTFEQVYETYLARMFLTGSGLNDSYEFTYSFFTDPVSGGRSIPLPAEYAVSPDALTVTGSTKAFSASSIRLMGTGTSTVNITADPSGEFRGMLIAVPKDFRHDIALKADYFAGYTFDSSLPGTFTTGVNSRITGTTSISANTEILLRFDPLFSGGDTLRFTSIVQNSTFGISALFAHDKAGSYEMSLFAGQGDNSLPFVGRIPVVTVNRGSGTFELPADYFTGILLDTTVPTETAAGQAVRVSGTLADPSLSRILIKFTETTTRSEIESYVDVTAGVFESITVFAPEQTGTYEMEIFSGLTGQSLPSVGAYLGFSVIAADGPISLPADFFEGFRLSTGLPTTFGTGKGFSLAGSVDDTSLEVILFRFTAENGDQVRFQTDVSQGTFRKGAVFFPSQAGTYTLDVFAGPNGQSLPHRGSFSPIVVTAGLGPVFLPVDIFTGLLLDEPLLSEFFSDESRNLIGTLTDQTITQIALRLDGLNGSVGESEFASVSGGRFSVPLPVTGLRSGDYEIVLFAGQAGQSLPFLDSFGPVSIVASQPRLALSETMLTFATTEAGQTTTQTVTVSNVGSETLSLLGITIESGPFTVTASTSTIVAGGNAILTIASSPVSAGVQTGILTLTTNDPSQQVISISLSGQATAIDPPAAPLIAVSANTLAFAETGIGASQILNLTAKNPGGAELIISSISAAGPFSLSIQSGTIAAGDSLVVEVTFVPVTAGSLDGTVTFISNASGDPVIVSLSGTAISSSTGDSESALLGDIDGSGSVDFTDFLSFARAFGATSEDALYDARADLDSNGSIDFSDFLTFAGQFGKSL